MIRQYFCWERIYPLRRAKCICRGTGGTHKCVPYRESAAMLRNLTLYFGR